MALGSLSAACAETITVVFKTGRRVGAELDPRTDEQHLWLVFGSDRVRVTRRLVWSEISDVIRNGESLPAEAVQQLARASSTPDTTVNPRHSFSFPVPEISDESEQRPQRSGPPRVRTIRFDATIANWDDDVEADGVMIRPHALSSTGESLSVSGTLHIDLWSMKRVGQDEVPRSRGRAFERVGQWSVNIRSDSDSAYGGWIQLPFQAIHPEVDTGWSPMGLIHVEFAVPGHGVFHHSEEGVRIRPYAPMRDALERGTGTRNFAGENRGRT